VEETTSIPLSGGLQEDVCRSFLKFRNRDREVATTGEGVRIRRSLLQKRLISNQ